jgi:uncharacterized protein (TIGR03083 family)
VRPLFARERAELLALLRELYESDWQRPTVCPGWRVHDVVAHVAHDYIRKLSGRRDWFPAPGPVAGETLPAFLDRVNQQFVDVAARWSPQVLIDLLGHLGPELEQLWASLDLGQLGAAVFWAAPDVPAPAWLDVAREYTEYWVHQQQIRDAAGKPGANDDELTFPVMDTFLRAVPHALRLVPSGPGTCVEIRVTGAGGGTWTGLAAGRRLGRGARLSEPAGNRSGGALVRLPVAGGDSRHLRGRRSRARPDYRRREPGRSGPQPGLDRPAAVARGGPAAASCPGRG